MHSLDLEASSSRRQMTIAPKKDNDKDERLTERLSHFVSRSSFLRADDNKTPKLNLFCFSEDKRPDNRPENWRKYTKAG